MNKQTHRRQSGMNYLKQTAKSKTNIVLDNAPKILSYQKLNSSIRDINIRLNAKEKRRDAHPVQAFLADFYEMMFLITFIISATSSNDIIWLRILYTVVPYVLILWCFYCKKNMDDNQKLNKSDIIPIIGIGIFLTCTVVLPDCEKDYYMGAFIIVLVPTILVYTIVVYFNSRKKQQG